MKKIYKENFQKLAEIYNQQGKEELYKRLKNKYEIKNPTCVFRRMITDESLGFDKELDKFTFHKCIEDDVFISFDELCAPKQERKR